MAGEWTHAGDVFALVMLGVVAMSFGVLGLLWWSMRRHAARRDPEVDALLEEVARGEDGDEVAPAKPAAAEWEKEGDWWKGG